jgi:uncharacterized membrane protein
VPDTEAAPLPQQDEAPGPSRPTGRSFGRKLLYVCLLALVVRGAFVLIEKRDEPAIGDAIYYDAQANVNADGDFFEHPFDGGPAADHPPLTAIVMTPVAFVFGDEILPKRLAMSVLGVAVVALIGLLARDVSRSERVGVIAGVVAALYPNLWLNDALVMSETIATLATAAVLLLAVRFHRRPTWGAAAVLGLACGLSVLARAELALLVPFVVLPLALLSGDDGRGRRLGRALLAGALSVLVVMPWTLWNTTRFEEPVLLSSNDGLTLIGANCESMYYGKDIGVWDLVCAFAVDTDAATDQSEESVIYREAALEYLGNQKSRMPVVALARVGRVWSVYAPGQMVDYSAGAVDTCRAGQEDPCPGEGREAWAGWLGTVLFWVLAPLAVFGTLVLRRRGRSWLDLLPVLMTFVVVTITAVLFYGLVRFRVPAEVGLVVLAAAGIDDLWSRWGRPSPPTDPEPAPEPALASS